MSWPTNLRRLARSWGLALLLGTLGSGGHARAQQPAPAAALLARRVAPASGSHSLGELLVDLSRQSGIPFSYSSSLIAVGRRYRLPAGPPRPLGDVLSELLQGSSLTYNLVDGQLVLCPAPGSPPSGGAAVAGPLANPARVSAARPALPIAGARLAAEGQLTHNRHAAKALSNQPASATTLPAAGRLANARVASGRAAPPRSLGGAAADSRARSGSRVAAAPAAAEGRAGRLLGGSLPGGKPAGGRLVATGSGPRGHQLSSRPAGPGRAAAAGLPAASATVRAMARLAPRPATLRSDLPANSRPPGQLPETRAVARPLAAGAAPVGQGPHLNLARLWEHTYLHGEAWLSESLPVGGTIKVGIPQVQLVLGAAIGPLDRRSGIAWGLGLGTSGRARGRFTPSLDLLAWALPRDSDDDDLRHPRLVQLRPLLAWQLKREGQVALLLGPTLNLATATQTSNRRWSFGQDQWLWLNRTDDQRVQRLWPGVQVGVRF